MEGVDVKKAVRLSFNLSVVVVAMESIMHSSNITPAKKRCFLDCFLTLNGVALFRNRLLLLGFQGPRLPWSYPSEAAAAYPESKPLPLPQHKESPLSPSEGAEWFRPVEVAGSVLSLTHAHTLPSRPFNKCAARV